MSNYLVSIIVLLLFNACTESYQEVKENVSDITIQKSSISGIVVDNKGLPLANVAVQLRYQNHTVYSKDDGTFEFKDVEDKNDMFILRKDGYYDAIYTFSTTKKENISLEIKAKSQENVRLLFTGDLSFARRFMDPFSPDRTTQLIEHDVEEATLKVSNLHASGQQVIDSMRPLFHSVDFPTVNFESIATRNQRTLDAIHPTKDYAYYTNDNSLPLLKDLNVNFVTLGNNHVYDYNSVGLQDTMDALRQNDIEFSGAGLSVEEAFKPYQTTIKDRLFSFIGATSIRGDKHQNLLYVAHENEGSDDIFMTQGGAANAHDRSNISKILHQERLNSYFAIYQFHGGIEYTFAPNDTALKLIYHAVENNASLVISHHPHVAQGYGMKDGVFLAYGLGNFIFDQDRLDTLLSHILVCDVNTNSTTHAIGYPIYIEDYIPKLLTGDLANRFIRHISEASRNGSALLEAPLVSDLMIFPYNYQEYMALDGKYTTHKQTLNKKITIDNKGYAILDLRNDLSSEYSLSAISTDTQNLSVTMGRDLLWFGSFEDDDVDSENYENSIWNFSNSVASSRQSHWGKASAHLLGDQSNPNTTLLYFGRRIRPIGDALRTPNKSLSFLGYFKGDNARPFSIEAKYYASVGEKEFGSTLLHSSNGETFDWQQIEANIPLPLDTVFDSNAPIYLSQNARALKFYIRMNETHKGQAYLYVDDLAIINWEESYSSNQSIKLSTPHTRDFIKVSGVQGEYDLKLEFTKYMP